MATSASGVSNWQHPDNSVEAGEALISRIYTALKESSYWNSSVLLITYDEHGGFFDHQAPPQCPPPDSTLAPNGFDFTRLGIRVPTVAVSPWIPKNTLVTTPQGSESPTATSQFDHTSVISTANKIFGLDAHLSAREAWAGHFEGIFTGPLRPDSDCPTLPPSPPLPAHILRSEMATPLNDHHIDSLNLLCGLTQGLIHPVCAGYGGERDTFTAALTKQYPPNWVAWREGQEKGKVWEHLNAPTLALLRQEHFEGISRTLFSRYKAMQGVKE